MTDAIDDQNSQKPDPQVTCGIVMPISAIDGLTEKHWIDVRSILEDAIETAGFEPRLVSEADNAGVIHKRIIQNLYQDEIVVCDVSAKNPNVMFELGLRLAFDKPVVIVKDDSTSYSFDTSLIEHISYPRDLRYNKINDFSEELARKVKATHEANKKDAEAASFLKNFGTFERVKVETSEISADVALLDGIQEIRREVSLLRQRGDHDRHLARPRSRVDGEVSIDLARIFKEQMQKRIAEMGLKSKIKIRENRETLQKQVLRDFPNPSRYFSSGSEFRLWFDAMFELAYG